MASRAAKVTIGVVGGLVGLILLVVIALVAWVTFRPLLTGDYNHTYGYMRTVNTLNDVPLAAMVASVGLGASAQGAEQYGNRISNTLSQIEVLTEELDGALDSRAGEKDEQVHQKLTELESAYDDLSGTFSEWEADGYALVADASEKCLKNEGSACADAVAAASGANAENPLLSDLLAASKSVADGSSVADLETARAALSDETAALWDAVEESASVATDYLIETGDVDE